MSHVRKAVGGADPTPSVAADRALLILELLAEPGEADRSIRGIAASLGLTKTTVHRLLETLARRGWVVQRTDGAYRLGARVLHVSTAVLRDIDVLATIRPIAQRIHADTNETVFVTVLDEGTLLIVDKFDSPSPLRLARPVGSRSPVHANAAGKALLALLSERELAELLVEPLRQVTPRTITDPAAIRRELEQVRRQGYAVSDEEGLMGVFSVAAVIRDHTGCGVAGLSIAGPAERMRPRSESCITAVVGAAREASANLGFASERPMGARAFAE